MCFPFVVTNYLKEDFDDFTCFCDFWCVACCSDKASVYLPVIVAIFQLLHVLINLLVCSPVVVPMPWGC